MCKGFFGRAIAIESLIHNAYDGQRYDLRPFCCIVKRKAYHVELNLWPIPKELREKVIYVSITKYIAL